MSKKLLILMILVSCSDKTISTMHVEAIYKNQCMQCHNANPNKVGSIGPDLVSTPKEAFIMKVVEGKYPEGYTPKRKTKAMPVFKKYKNDVEALYNYIQTFKESTREE